MDEPVLMEDSCNPGGKYFKGDNCLGGRVSFVFWLTVTTGSFSGIKIAQKCNG